MKEPLNLGEPTDVHLDEDTLKSAAAQWVRERRGQGLLEDDLVRIWSTPWPALVQDVKRAASGPDLPTPNAMLPASRQGAIPLERALCRNLFFLPLALHFFSTDTQEVRRKVNIVGLERLDDALEACGRVCLLGAHVGPALAPTYVLNLLGYKVSHQSRRNMYAGLKLPRHETITHIPTEGFRLASLARAMADLEAGRIVFTAGDGVEGASSATFGFLGKSRQFQFGFGYAATRCKAEAIPVFSRFDGAGKVTIEFGAPLCPIAEGRPDHERQERIVAGYVAALEEYWLLHENNVWERQLRLHASRPDGEQTSATSSGQARG